MLRIRRAHQRLTSGDALQPAKKPTSVLVMASSPVPDSGTRVAVLTAKQSGLELYSGTTLGSEGHEAHFHILPDLAGSHRARCIVAAVRSWSTGFSTSTESRVGKSFQVASSY